MTHPGERQVEFERTLIERISAAIEDLRSDLEAFGVRTVVHGLPVAVPAEECELRIDFLLEEDLVDIIEFHLYLEGVPAASPSELDGWFRGEVGRLISRLQA